MPQTPIVVVTCLLIGMFAFLSQDSSKAKVRVQQQTERAQFSLYQPMQPGQRKQPAKDLPGTILGAKSPSEIPNAIAIEMLTLSLSTDKAEWLAEKIGIGLEFGTEKDIESTIKQARLFARDITYLDKIAAEARGKAFKSSSDRATQMNDLTIQRDALTRKHLYDLTTLIDGKSYQALLTHLNHEVKSKVKKIPVNSTGAESLKKLTKTKPHYLYTYLTGWRDDSNWIGLSIFIPDYPAEGFEGVESSVTTIAPDGVRESTGKGIATFGTAINMWKMPIQREFGDYTTESVINTVANGQQVYVASLSMATMAVPMPQINLIFEEFSLPSLCPTTGKNVATADWNVTTANAADFNRNVSVSVAGQIIQGLGLGLTLSGNTNTPSIQVGESGGSGHGTITATLSDGGSDLVNRAARVQVSITAIPDTLMFPGPNGQPSPVPIRYNPRFADQALRLNRPCPTPAPSPSPTPRRPDISQLPACGPTVVTALNCGSVGLCSTGAAGFARTSSVGEDCCCRVDPLIIDVNRTGFQFSDVAGGVSFDLNGQGQKHLVAWPTAISGNAWLVLDLNGNGAIDNGTELFGNFSPQVLSPNESNGFLALAEYDKTAFGGNGDFQITSADAIWPLLRLWQDSTRNGISEPYELIALADRGIASIPLSYQMNSYTDPNGNDYRYRGTLVRADGTQDVIYDVYPRFDTIRINLALNPITVCDGSGQSAATLSWFGPPGVEIREGGSQGSLVAIGSLSGNAVVNVVNGSYFCLVDPVSGAVLGTATAVVNSAASGCAIQASYYSIETCDGVGYSALYWNASGATTAAVRMDTVTGPLFAVGTSGSQATGMLTGGGRRYFLLDTTNGSPGKIIGTALITLRPPAAGCPITASPNPIIVCSGNVGTTTIDWEVPNVTSTQIRINDPSGKLFASGDKSGSQATGEWVTNGMKFYVIDTSNGVPDGARTPVVKGVTTVTVTNQGCGSSFTTPSYRKPRR